MTFLAGLPRCWVSIQLPGTARPRRLTTYVSYTVEAIPPLPLDVAQMDWLERATPHPEDYLATCAEAARRDLSWSGVAELCPDTDRLPGDFVRFLGVNGPGLRDRLRSATDCYFDLGDALVEVDGGVLLHLISDSQWVFHWLLYLGDDGDSAVLGTTSPEGFDVQPEDSSRGGEPASYIVVADSFAEFAWRWWMDNEIFHHVIVDKVPLSEDQVHYLQQYGDPLSL